MIFFSIQFAAQNFLGGAHDQRGQLLSCFLHHLGFFGFDVLLGLVQNFIGLMLGIHDRFLLDFVGRVGGGAQNIVGFAADFFHFGVFPFFEFFLLRFHILGVF